jgi:hypothetical protein
MRILNMRVERIGTPRGARHVVVGRGRDVVTRWRISFVVPAAISGRVVSDVRAGRHPVIAVPEANAMPWAGVGPIDWE